MRKRNVTLFLLLLFSFPSIFAQIVTLSLDSCRQLAIDNNKELKMTAKQCEATYYENKAAFTNYLPKVSVSGIYMHTGKELSLLSDEQKSTISNIGVPELNSLGQGLVEALRTDTRNMTGATIMLTQPIYMGGKIKAYNNITKFAERIASSRHNLKLQELIVKVDETYWNIVALSVKKHLAQSYLNLVKTLDNDIEQMVEEGLCYQG